MNNMVYIGNAGSKNPGITCLLRCAIFNLEENSDWEGIDYVKNAWFDDDGISVEIDQEGWDKPMSNEEFAGLPVDLINQLIREIPKVISGIMINSDQTTEEDKIADLEDIINNSEETTVKGGGNFKYGDEKIALRLLREAKGRYSAKGPDESMKFGEAKRILESEGLKLSKDCCSKKRKRTLKESSLTIWDYLDELEEIDPSAREMMIEELVENSDNIVRGDDGCYYDTSVGRDSMTDDPMELLQGISYDDLVADYGTPEEFANN